MCPSPSDRPPLPFDPLRFSLPPRKVEDRQGLIAQEAYYRAERRGFEPGHEMEDWLAAEIEVDRQLGGKSVPPT
jgi:hypothetical protein